MSVPMKTTLPGVVKAVPSGDTLVLVKPGPSAGPPPELRLTLSSLRAPALRPDAADEPFAFASREFLRRRLIGKQVTFVVDYQVAAAGQRLFGSVHEGPGTPSVAHDIVSAGLARVRRPASEREARADDFDLLCQLEDAAVAEKRGLHAAAGAAAAGRLLEQVPDPAEFARAFRGHKLNAIVEHVITGSALRLLVHKPGSPGTYHPITLHLCGIQSPGFRKDDQDPPQTIPMPFALNARFFTEMRLLNRDITLVIRGADRNGSLFGTLDLPTLAPDNIDDLLIRAGLAKTAPWSIDANPRAAALRSSERQARDARLACWTDYVPDPNAASASSERFTGRVLEVVSGDVVVVLDSAVDQPRRLNLASVRAPRLGRAGGPDAPYAREAKEYLRKRMIGRRVAVKIEYERTPPATTEGAPPPTKQVYATITKEAGDDFALGLLGSGLATVIRHRGDEERAAAYEDYLVKEKEATDAKKGMHSPKTPPPRRINDMTGPDARKRSKEMATFYQREGIMKGLVEYVSTGSRFRVLLSKDDTLVNIALKGARSPAPSRKPAPGAPNGHASQGEPYGDAALQFSRENFMQRDVEVEIQGVDKLGTFLGNLMVLIPSQTGVPDKRDVSLALLENGLGKLHDFFDPQRDAGGAVFLAAQNAAKQAKRGMWENFKEPSAEELAAEEAAIAAEQSEGGKNCVKGKVVEIGDYGRLFLHEPAAADTMSKVQEALASLGLGSDDGAAGSRDASVPEWASIKVGSTLLARFQVDNKWYRARVIARDNDSKQLQVRFLDYGNVDICHVSNVRLLSAGSNLGTLPGAAKEVRLRGLVVPGEAEEYVTEAGGALRDLCFDKDVVVECYGKENDAILGEVLVGNSEVSVNREMLRLGLARIVRRKDRVSREVQKLYESDEETGRKTRRFLWRYGDAYASDEDDDEETRARYAARRAGP